MRIECLLDDGFADSVDDLHLAVLFDDTYLIFAFEDEI
jgi:hypothetical protein